MTGALSELQPFFIVGDDRFELEFDPATGNYRCPYCAESGQLRWAFPDLHTAAEIRFDCGSRWTAGWDADQWQFSKPSVIQSRMCRTVDALKETFYRLRAMRSFRNKRIDAILLGYTPPKDRAPFFTSERTEPMDELAPIVRPKERGSRRKYPQLPLDEEQAANRVFTLRVPPAVHAAMLKLAHEHQLSLNQLGVALMQQALEEAGLWPYLKRPAASAKDILSVHPPLKPEDRQYQFQPEGSCPVCGQPTTETEQRESGRSRCARGHEYDAAEAVREG